MNCQPQIKAPGGIVYNIHQSGPGFMSLYVEYIDANSNDTKYWTFKFVQEGVEVGSAC